MNDAIVATLDRCAALLAQCKTADQVKRLADLSEAARVYAKRIGASREVVNRAAEYKLRAERRLGEILAKTEKAKGAAGGGKKTGPRGTLVEPRDKTPKLDDVGISKKLSSRAQKLAAVPAEVFEAKIAEAKEATKELGFTTFADRAARKVVHAAKVARPLPEGKHRVIYSDPPWKYRDSGLDDYWHAERHYPSMSVEELCALPVRNMAADDSVLYLWVPSPMLEEAFKIIRDWRFDYKASFVWDKVKHNYGHYNSVRHEFLMVATRGSCTPETSKLFDSVVTEERTKKHSEKPEPFRKIIEAMYPSGPWLELFARTKAEGWTVYGNENLS